MILVTILESIRYLKQRWFPNIAMAALAVLAGSNPLLGETPSRSNQSPLVGGVHLYGESNRPDVIGKEYIIFETIGTKTIGAFYLPQSEFSCFSGQFKGSQLNVTIFDPYDSQKYKYSLSIQPKGLTASKQPMMGEPTYQPLSKISNNDRRILAACKLQLHPNSSKKS
jgi:hypothetical protein